jgi:hypothetical protein
MSTLSRGTRRQSLLFTPDDFPTCCEHSSDAIPRAGPRVKVGGPVEIAHARYEIRWIEVSTTPH